MGMWKMSNKEWELMKETQNKTEVNCVELVNYINGFMHSYLECFTCEDNTTNLETEE